MARWEYILDTFDDLWNSVLKISFFVQYNHHKIIAEVEVARQAEK